MSYSLASASLSLTTRPVNGKVVGYFGIVKDALVEADFVFFEGLGGPGSNRMAGLGDILRVVCRTFRVVFRQVAGSRFSGR